MRDPKAYTKKVESYVEKYASAEDADKAGGAADGDEPMSRSNRDRDRNGNGNGNGAAGNGHSNGVDADGEDDDESVSDKMSDMGELSDGDEFMGEMDD